MKIIKPKGITQKYFTRQITSRRFDVISILQPVPNFNGLTNTDESRGEGEGVTRMKEEEKKSLGRAERCVYPRSKSKNQQPIIIWSSRFFSPLVRPSLSRSPPWLEPAELLQPSRNYLILRERC